jgi:transposase InsO family protein
VVLDAFSRRVVGWAMETYLRTELVLKALDMALEQRQPAGVIHHSRPGQPIYLDRFRQMLLRGGRATLNGISRRLL